MRRRFPSKSDPIPPGPKSTAALESLRRVNTAKGEIPEEPETAEKPFRIEDLFG